METRDVVRAYSFQSSFYDLVFEPFYGSGQRRALHAMDLQPGQRVLEVGAGTGLSLRHYPNGVQLTGIDLAEPMLAKAQRRAEALGMDVDFQIMDAQSMDFPDHYFDQVVAMYLASVVPEPAKMVAEMRRVCRPGGKITLVNHLCSDALPTQALRWALSPLKTWLGFRPLYSRSALLQAAGGLDWRSVNGRRHGFVVLQAVNL